MYLQDSLLVTSTEIGRQRLSRQSETRDIFPSFSPFPYVSGNFTLFRGFIPYFDHLAHINDLKNETCRASRIKNRTRDAFHFDFGVSRSIEILTPKQAGKKGREEAVLTTRGKRGVHRGHTLSGQHCRGILPLAISAAR